MLQLVLSWASRSATTQGSLERSCCKTTAGWPQGDGALACNKPAGWVPGPEYVVRPGRLEFARLDDLLGGSLDDIVVAKMDVEARPAPVCARGARRCAVLPFAASNSDATGIDLLSKG